MPTSNVRELIVIDRWRGAWEGYWPVLAGGIVAGGLWAMKLELKNLL